MLTGERTQKENRVIRELHEETGPDFAGTVLDIETIGGFSAKYKSDSRRCKDIRQVILGYINQKHLHIYCAENEEGIEKLKQMTPGILESLERPFYAFNCGFESSVWFHHSGIKIKFDGELQDELFESKKVAVKKLRISNYDDPFFDAGYRCMEAWWKKDFSGAIAHNRACLLKERDILLMRGYCEPEEVKFVK
jgi:hypothetical protein